ncbi:MAG: hypothetical protein AAF213_02720 [Pseudomonadota bacterium]
MEYESVAPWNKTTGCRILMAHSSPFRQRMVGLIEQRFPAFSDTVLCVNRERYDDIHQAIDAGLKTASPELASRVSNQLFQLPEQAQQNLRRSFHRGVPFAMPLDFAPGDLAPATILNPLPNTDNIYEPNLLGASLVPWHQDVVAQNTDAQALARSELLREMVCWHEVGHVICDPQGHEREMGQLVLPTLPSTPDGAAAKRQRFVAERAMSEHYADGFGLRHMGVHDPARALETAQHMADWRALSLMASLVNRRTDTAAYEFGNTAVTAIRDIVANAEDGIRKTQDIAVQTGRWVVANGIDMPAIAELDATGPTLARAVKRGPRAFAYRLGRLGQAARHPLTHGVMRDYVAAMTRLLPQDHGLQGPLAKADKRIGRNRHAAAWSQDHPTVEAAVIAGRAKLRRLPSAPQATATNAGIPADSRPTSRPTP